ncbi:hypothetical protein C3L33_10124, partial [Rhododendron williamsianum]
MEEMRGAAMAYYANMSEDQQQSFERFNSLMDGNGDGKVRFQEYLDFIRKQGYNHVPSNLFRLLDENNRGYLDFEECVTLFYMISAIGLCSVVDITVSPTCWASISYASNATGLVREPSACVLLVIVIPTSTTNTPPSWTTMISSTPNHGSVINRVSHEPIELIRFLASVKFRTSANLA